MQFDHPLTYSTQFTLNQIDSEIHHAVDLHHLHRLRRLRRLRRLLARICDAMNALADFDKAAVVSLDCVFGESSAQRN